MSSPPRRSGGLGASYRARIHDDKFFLLLAADWRAAAERKPNTYPLAETWTPV
jgi:hypothetical protein